MSYKESLQYEVATRHGMRHQAPRPASAPGWLWLVWLVGFVLLLMVVEQ